jgi:glycosyltransferase involved in cell wall biosynthesis
MIKLSYGITVHDEADELNRLLEVLVHKTDKEDEIVICVDGEDDAVEHVLQSWTQQYGHDGMKIIKIYQRKLDGDFAAQKNSVIENSTGDYIFHIDADEYPSDGLLEYVKPVLEANDIDLIWVPRVNTVDGITEEHIQQWGWRVSESGWVNYPDYQSRIFKNTPELRWQNKVHERIMGAKNYSHLPPNETLSLYHPKTIQKQEKQNKFYETL